MTRVYNDAGEHVPVTVLRMENCQVVAQRTEEKNGYTAVQLGVGLAKVKNTSKALRGHFAKRVRRAEGEGRRVPRVAGQPARRRRRDHRRPLRRRPEGRRDGHLDRQGLPGRHEALEFRRRPRDPRQLGVAPYARFDRPAPGPGQGVQGQEDGRPHGRRPASPRRTSKSSRTDADRGLILIRGAVPGTKGAWILVRDAVKVGAAGRTRRSRPACAPAAKTEAPAAEGAE